MNKILKEYDHYSTPEKFTRSDKRREVSPPAINLAKFEPGSSLLAGFFTDVLMKHHGHQLDADYEEQFYEEP